MSSLMINTGVLLANQIDAIIGKRIKTYQQNRLRNIVSSGHSKIGRMLHYYPYA